MKKVKKNFWKKIKKDDYKTLNKCVQKLKSKKVYLSPWIENIISNKRNEIKLTKKNIFLYRVKVSDLGFNKAVKLKHIYNKLKKKKYILLPPDIALRARLLYFEQKKGEWLRFATPFKSMIDTDGVPHLPKLGRALQRYFIETYWSYPDAIFHPHNEFVVGKNEKK